MNEISMLTMLTLVVASIALLPLVFPLLELYTRYCEWVWSLV